MLKLLITGGAGYIGAHAVLKALESNFDVYILDNLEKSDMKSLETLKHLTKNKFKFFQIDMRNYKDLDQLLSLIKPDYIMHFAGYKSVADGENNPDSYYENNFGCVENLLNSMRNNNLKNIIFSSTAAVYGNPLELPITESTFANPLSVYGKSKLQAEEAIVKASQIDKTFNSTIFRYFNVIGNHPSGLFGEDSRLCTNLLPVILENVIGNRPYFELFGDKFDTADGSQERDYIDVNDLVNAHFLAITNELKGCNIINLSTAKPISCKKMIDTVSKVTGVEPICKIVRPRFGDPIISFSDNKLAKKMIKWQPKVSLEDSIKNQWKWININQN